MKPEEFLTPISEKITWLITDDLTENGDNLRLDFGFPTLKVRDIDKPKKDLPFPLNCLSTRKFAMRGDFTLFTHDVLWEGNAIIEGMKESIKSERLFLHFLKGQYLKEFIVDLNLKQTTFKFDLGLELLLRKNPEKEIKSNHDNKIWAFYRSDESKMTFDIHGELTCKKGEEKVSITCDKTEMIHIVI